MLRYCPSKNIVIDAASNHKETEHADFEVEKSYWQDRVVLPEAH